MNVPQRAVETPMRGQPRQPPRQIEDVFDPGRLYDIFDPRRLGGDAGSGYDIFDPRRIEGEYDIFDPRRLGGGGGGGRSAYLSSRFGGGLGNQFARNAGANGMLENMIMASGPGMDDDDYGPFVPSSVLEMDIEDTIYGPSDEYDFDRKRGYPGQIWGKPPVYSARGGIIS